MPKARDPKREQARELWETGQIEKLCDIAERLGVLEVTVRGWKSKDKWVKKNIRNVPINNGNRTVNVPNVPNPQKRKRGAQPGHPYYGGAPPKGSLNAAKTGEYVTIFAHLIKPEEMERKDDYYISIDNRIISHKNSLFILRIRESRLLEIIQQIDAGAEMITIKTHSTMEPSGKKGPDGRDTTKLVRISTEQEARREQRMKVEEALTRVQAEIRRKDADIQKWELEQKEFDLRQRMEMGAEQDEISILEEMAALVIAQTEIDIEPETDAVSPDAPPTD